MRRFMMMQVQRIERSPACRFGCFQRFGRPSTSAQPAARNVRSRLNTAGNSSNAVPVTMRMAVSRSLPMIARPISSAFATAAVVEAEMSAIGGGGVVSVAAPYKRNMNRSCGIRPCGYAIQIGWPMASRSAPSTLSTVPFADAVTSSRASCASVAQPECATRTSNDVVQILMCLLLLWSHASNERERARLGVRAAAPAYSAMPVIFASKTIVSPTSP
jgi:hypothetical protein